VRTVAGALAIGVGETVALIIYFALRCDVVSDPDGFPTRVHPMLAKRQTLMTVGTNVGPGLWIG
jgi:hypothetical protein